MGESKPDYLGSFSVGCIKAGNDTHMPRCKQNIDDMVEAVTTGNEKEGYNKSKLRIY